MTLRPYLPASRATVAAVPRRRGRPPAAVSAEIRSRAIAIVADRAARGEPPIDGEALAAELGCAPSAGRRILAELRAAELAPPAVPSATGRQMARPPAPGKVVRIRAATLARLADATGRPVGEDVDGQVCDLLNLYTGSRRDALGSLAMNRASPTPPAAPRSPGATSGRRGR